MRTVDNWLAGIGRSRQAALDCPVWPPDLFAIAGALLRLSGAYIEIFSQKSRSKIDIDAATKIAKSWRSALDEIKTPSPALLEQALPVYVKDTWGRLVDQRGISIRDIHANKTVARDLISLVIIADATCGGIGIDIPDDKSRFLAVASEVLTSNDLQSCTWDIPVDAIGVLPKQHTPQRGATLRSLTHHLALYVPNDIRARWEGPLVNIGKRKGAEIVNFLLAPWPLGVESADFRLATPPGSTGTYFEYHPSAKWDVKRVRTWLSRAFREAKKQAQSIDVVVFPELALSIEEYVEVERLCIDRRAMLIAGIRVPATKAARGQNICVLQPTGLLLRDSKEISQKERNVLSKKYRLLQSKHHRWCLDRNQILHYQLAGHVEPAASVWENIVIHPRRLNFVTLGNWMTWSVLVCEDLARQDPAADLIRSVGPNLLVALLMDGPQLRGRWSSRYASVLADDPGTSVLTLTSLGMAERSRPIVLATGRRADKNRAIGLWKDVETGEHEIVLDAGDNACVLTVGLEKRNELSADGRSDGGKSCYPVFAGYKSFRVEQ